MKRNTEVNSLLGNPTNEQLEQEVKQDVLRLYLKGKTVSTISRELKLSAPAVYTILNYSVGHIQIQLDLQLKEVVENSVTALALLSGQIEEAIAAGLNTREELKNNLARVEMYSQLYDKTVPFMEQYLRRMPVQSPDKPLLKGLNGHES